MAPPKKSDIAEINSELSEIQAALSEIPKKGELKELIGEAIDSVITSLRDNLKSEIKEELVAELGIDELKSDIFDLRQDNDNLKNELENKSKAIADLQTTVEKLSKMSKAAFCQSNQNEQYSRKNNIKVFDMPVETDENLLEKFITVMKDKGGVRVDRDEIAAIHRIDHRDKKITKPVLVKFVSTDAKMRYISARKQLKTNKSVRLADDVTKANVMLINRLKAHLRIENSWYFNGRVYGESTEGKKIKFYPHDDINAILGNY